MSEPEVTPDCFGEYPLMANQYAEKCCADCPVEEGCYTKWKDRK